MFSTSPLHKLCGLIASATLTAGSSVISAVTPTIPAGASAVREWSLIIGAPVGVAGMLFYAVSMMYDSRSKARREREEHRKELAEMQAEAARVAATVASTAVKAAQATVATAAATAANVVDAASATASELIAECTRRQTTGECPMQKVLGEHAIQFPKPQNP
jgi:crotonobetainyl-CoA:carnitine CoA-transferase CaiB-like acyl-CoA transferase